MTKYVFIVSIFIISLFIGMKYTQPKTIAMAAPASIEDSVKKYTLNLKDVKLSIQKSSYRVDLYLGGKRVKSYPCVLGPNPTDDKTHEGDGCTPEGTYKIKAKYPHRNWSYFLWVDYPNDAAWKRFNENKKSGKLSKSATIGGEIGIHGVPFLSHDFGKETPKGTAHNDELIDEKVNWTAGCISLKTNDIIELYKYVLVGSDVEIVH